MAQNSTPDEAAPACSGNRRCAFPWQLMVIDLTGEVLPCPYYHFAGSGQSLGNTNREVRRGLTVPRYEAPPRPKNLQYVKLGIADGLRLEQRIAMSDAYTALAAKERAAGFGFLEQDPQLVVAIPRQLLPALRPQGLHRGRSQSELSRRPITITGIHRCAYR